MQITVTNHLNINHKGYFKTHKVLLHNLDKAKFKFYVSKCQENQKLLEKANNELTNFYNKNRVISFLIKIPINLFNKIKNNDDEEKIKLVNQANSVYDEFNISAMLCSKLFSRCNSF